MLGALCQKASGRKKLDSKLSLGVMAGVKVQEKCGTEGGDKE